MRRVTPEIRSPWFAESPKKKAAIRYRMAAESGFSGNCYVTSYTPSIIQSCTPKATSEATKAMAPTATLTSPADAADGAEATVMAAPLETDLEAEAGAGF